MAEFFSSTGRIMRPTASCRIILEIIARAGENGIALENLIHEAQIRIDNISSNALKRVTDTIRYGIITK